MKNQTVGYLTLAIVFGLGLAVGYLVADTRTESEMITRATADELLDGLDVYRACMQSSSRSGCRMSIENFRTYHAIKRELEHRGVAYPSP